jgi:hypothetical protein
LGALAKGDATSIAPENVGLAIQAFCALIMAAKSGLFGCFVVLLFLSFTHFAIAAGTEQKTRWLIPRTNITGPNPNDYECESARAADYYGIGVRLVIHDARASCLQMWHADVVLLRVTTSPG